MSFQYSSSRFLVFSYGENVKSGFSDTIPGGSGERKAVKDMEMALHSRCIKIICFSGINMTFVIVTDFFKSKANVGCGCFPHATFMSKCFTNDPSLRRINYYVCIVSFVNCLANRLRNNV